MYDMISGIKEGGTFLLNTNAPADQAFATLTKEMQQTIVDKKVKFYVVVSGGTGSGARVFCAVSGGTGAGARRAKQYRRAGACSRRQKTQL